MITTVHRISVHNSNATKTLPITHRTDTPNIITLQITYNVTMSMILIHRQ